MIQFFPTDIVHFLCCLNKSMVATIVWLQKWNNIRIICRTPLVLTSTSTPFLLAPNLWNIPRRRNVAGFTLRPTQNKIKYPPTPNILWIEKGVGTKIALELREAKISPPLMGFENWPSSLLPRLITYSRALLIGHSRHLKVTEGSVLCPEWQAPGLDLDTKESSPHFPSFVYCVFIYNLFLKYVYLISYSISKLVMQTSKAMALKHLLVSDHSEQETQHKLQNKQLPITSGL